MTNSFAKASYHQRVTHFTEELNFSVRRRRQGLGHGAAILSRLNWAEFPARA